MRFLFWTSLIIIYMPNQWIVFFARSDWLLKLGIVSAIHLPAFFRISRASFHHLSEKRNYLVLAIYCFGKYWNKLFTSVLMTSGRYLRLAKYPPLYIRLHFGEWLTIILWNRAEYHLILSRRGRRPSCLNQGIFRKIEQDNCFIIQQILIDYHFHVTWRLRSSYKIGYFYTSGSKY